MKYQENQIDHIIDSLDGNILWYIGHYSNSTEFHFMRCEYINKPSNKLTTVNEYYYITSPCEIANTQTVYNEYYVNQLNQFTSSLHDSITTTNISTDNLRISLFDYKLAYNRSCHPHSFIYFEYPNHMICRTCYKWFKHNKFRFPELNIISENNGRDIKFIFSNGKEFGKYDIPIGK